ncbi:NADP-dependent oxidoreductase [Nocardia salmonicida]|uniref:NADP-dependent oxidoreductase n=1 Tax=Nocardia salmonicida TaxID=53431 RepID=UPI00379148E1
MKAVIQQRLGGPEVLETAEVEIPEPGPGEVLVHMRATAVNVVDCKLRSGAVTFLGPPPFTVGFDVSGLVEAVGPDVDRFVPGELVFGMVHSRTGTYSEYVVASADSLSPLPQALREVEAAALPTAAMTAWQSLAAAKLQEGERILVHAAAGGVGHLAVQFAKQRGAYVIGTARKANHDFLHEVGIDQVIDYTTTDFTSSLEEVDVVLDLVGGEYGHRSLQVLRRHGRYITTQASDASPDPRYRSITARPRPSELTIIAELVTAGCLRIHVDRILPLDEVVRAHTVSESGRVRGKLVLTPWR